MGSCSQRHDRAAGRRSEPRPGNGLNGIEPTFAVDDVDAVVDRAVAAGATLDRPVHCLLPAGQIGSVFRKLAGWALGMQAFDSLSGEQDSLLNPCLSVLASHGTIALFAEPFPQDGGPRAPLA